MKITNLQAAKRTAQKRYVRLERLPVVSKLDDYKKIEHWHLPDVDHTGEGQPSTEQWNRIQWDDLQNLAGRGEGDPVVWAMNMIAELQAMWLEATDELEEYRKAGR